MKRQTIRKTTGYDNVSPKNIKMAQPVISSPIKIFVNISIENSIFPDNLQAGLKKELLFKKRKLYLKISVLPCIYTIYERVYT